MPTRSALTLIDAIADETARIGVVASDGALKAQAALVRALVDEVGRHHPSHRSVAPLHAQLGEELSRLAELAELAEPPQRSVDEAPGPERVEVLVVDDDVPSLLAIASFVRELGHPCRTASDGERALAEYELHPADIVLADWRLPGMSGLELCQAVKQRNPCAYVILVTGHEEAGGLEGVQGSVDDFLRKPIDLDELVVRLGAAERLVRAVQVVERIRVRLKTLPAPAPA